MTIAFIAWAGLIPVVPLIGVDIFRRRKEKVKKNVCIGLFVLQLLLSIGYITAYLNQ